MSERRDTFNGRICAYFDHLKVGSIVADGGETYTFHLGQWLSQEREPQAGLQVTFQPNITRAFKVRAATN